MQRRLKDLYGNLVLLLSHIDWDQPYAVDLERIYAKCQERGRYTEDGSPAQERDISIIPYLVITSEALQMHEKAVAARDWANVDYTLRQFADIQWDYNFHVYARTEQSVAQVKKLQQAGERGGRPFKDQATICSDYDTLMAQNVRRSRVIARLARLSELSSVYINRVLRAAARGAPKKPTRCKKT
jgi:hypothetical protein